MYTLHLLHVLIITVRGRSVTKMAAMFGNVKVWRHYNKNE